MGYPAGHKDQTRQKIIDAARKLWKTKGYNGAGVDKIMAEAGLTRGGFYAHFKSKEDLLSEALGENLLKDGIRTWMKMGITDPREHRKRALNWYLSLDHVKDAASGCPLTTLSQEAPRLGEGPKQRIAANIDGFANWLSQEDPSTPGYAVLATMVGAISLARAMEDEEKAQKILEESLKAINKLLEA